MKCNALASGGYESSLRVCLAQPIQRIHLDAIDPNFPVQMRTRDTAGASDESNHLTGLHDVSHIDHDLRLMPEPTVNSPAMIDDGRIPSNCQRRGKNHFSSCWCKDL